MFESDNWILVAGQDQQMIDSFAKLQIERLKLGKRRMAQNDKTFLQPEQSILSGYRGEWAVSRWLEIEMDFTTDARQAMTGDLDFGIEVKATDNPNGNLYCSAKTFADYMRRSPNTPVVLAKTFMWPWVEISGWLPVKDLQRFPFKQVHAKHNPGYLVPVNRLRQMDELKKLCDYWKKTNANEFNLRQLISSQSEPLLRKII